jgi:predicted amidohydrolase
MPNTSLIAALQCNPQPTMETALEQVLDLAQRAVADGATFLATPEYCGGLVSEDGRLRPPHATEEDHKVLNGLKRYARQAGVPVLVGSVAITAENGHIWNRGFLLDAEGEVRARYSKIHLFDIQLEEGAVYRESATVSPGSEASVMETGIGRLGHTICYDLRFPALYRQLAQAGAEVLAVPAAFTKTTGAAHWHVLLRARAIENGAFVVAPGLVGGVPGGGATFGHSLIVDPWGEVLADGGESAGVTLAEIDLALVDRARTQIPSLSHDRPISIRALRDPAPV